MEIVLTQELEELVRQKVASGAYGSPSEVVVNSLHLLKAQDALERIRLEDLRREVLIGYEESQRGEGVPLDMEAIIADVEMQLKQERK